jgi:hypothetical protein
MDPIETWHDAPTFEAMEKRIKELENLLRRCLDDGGNWGRALINDAEKALLGRK